MDAVELTGSEEEVLGFLDHCLREHAAVSHVVLRVAGGWVRDKLLGKVGRTRCRRGKDGGEPFCVFSCFVFIFSLAGVE